LARVLGIESDIAQNKSEKEFTELAQHLMQNASPDLYNQAIMEFGAMQCSPQKPNCMFRPLQANCVAFAQNKQKELPKKSKKIKIKKRYFSYFIFEFEERILMQQRNKKDIWQGLYEFFLHETKSEFDNIDQVLKDCFADLKESFCIQSESEILKHQLTHQRVFVKFFHIKLKNTDLLQEKKFEDFALYSLEEVKNLAKPILLANYLENHFF